MSQVQIPAASAERTGIRNAVIFVGGLTQRRDAFNGVHEAYLRTYARHAGPETLVEYYPWFVDPAEIAAALAGLSFLSFVGRTERLRIVIVGFSFGGGTAVQLCRRLADTDNDVDALILCDPVARWFGRLGWTRAAFSRPIDVPNTVGQVSWFRQENRRWRLKPPFFYPSSHPVRVSEPTRLQRFLCPQEHVEMDNITAFQKEVDILVSKTVGRDR